jgi:hypothetical protein
MAVLAAALGAVGSAGVEPARADVERIREKALELEQKLNSHRYDVAARGNESKLLRVYKDFSFILAESKVKEVADEGGEDAERLRLYLIESIVALDLANYTDPLRNYERTGTVELDGAPVTYSAVLGRLAAASDERDRRKLYTALKDISEHANVFRNQIVNRTNEGFEGWGYEHFADFYATREGVDLDTLAAAARELLAASQEDYDGRFAEAAETQLGLEARKVKFVDVPYMLKGPAFENAFPAGERNRRVRALFQGLGIDTGSQSGLVFDDKRRDGRLPGGGVYPATVPSQVYTTLTPTGGTADDDREIQLRARAQSYVLSDQTRFEDAYLTLEAPVYAVAFLVRSVTDEPGFISEHSGLTGESLDAYRKFRAFVRLHEARTLAATLLYEIALYRGQEDAEEVFKDAMREATGIRLSSTDVTRALENAKRLDSAGRFQGLLLATQLRDHLVNTVGEDWYKDAKAASILKGWWKQGGTLTLADLRNEAGVEPPVTDVVAFITAVGSE